MAYSNNSRQNLVDQFESHVDRHDQQAEHHRIEGKCGTHQKDAKERDRLSFFYFNFINEEHRYCDSNTCDESWRYTQKASDNELKVFMVVDWHVEMDNLEVNLEPSE